ncbi:hypothetical protein [Xanthobacter pseudotagetidis]|uniref:hypothetical protein n=1 Tax=Xanthobacter pseudotagetidis TaxID=3119911 RepID=UPI00372BFA3A
MVKADLRLVRLALAAGLALSVSGCESMEKFNPFVEKERPLPGTRQKVFPEGVPGVDYSAAPSQPSNSNAVLDRLPDPSAKPGQPGQQAN